MSKLLQFFDFIFIPAVAAISLLIFIASFFGWLGAVPWLAATSIPVLTLLIGTLALSSLIRIQNNQTAFHQDIRAALAKGPIDTVRSTLEHLDPSLHRVFFGHFLKEFERLRSASEDKKAVIDEVDDFREFYIRTLLTHPGSTFLATTSPNETYLWKDQPEIESAMHNFLAQEGTIQRIFLVNGEEELASEEVQRLLQDQFDLGVDVYTVDWNTVPRDLRKIFLVEATGKLAWDSPIAFTAGPTYYNVPATVTAVRSETQEYIEIFKALKKTSAKPFKSSRSNAIGTRFGMRSLQRSIAGKIILLDGKENRRVSSS